MSTPWLASNAPYTDRISGFSAEYLPSLPGNAVIAGIYALFSLITFIHWFRSAKRARFGICLPIGLLFAAMGFAMRAASRSESTLKSISLYAVLNLFVVLSPATFLAFNYIVFGRMIVALDPTIDESAKRRTKSRYSLIPPRIVGRLFVWSDVITFIIQAAGGGLQAVGNSTADVGDKIFLAGVSLQCGELMTSAPAQRSQCAERNRSSLLPSSFVRALHPARRICALQAASRVLPLCSVLPLQQPPNHAPLRAPLLLQHLHHRPLRL